MACNLRKSYNILAFNSLAERTWRRWHRNTYTISVCWEGSDSRQSKLFNEKAFTEKKLMFKACPDCRLSLTDS